MPIRVGMVSLGCSKNLVDSERMLAKLRAHGYQLVTEPGEAEIAIVNTCGFIQSAKEEAIETILELGALKKDGTLKKIILTGCLTERYKEEAAELFTEADAVIGIGDNRDIVDILDHVLAGERVVRFGKKSDAEMKGDRIITTLPFFAYLKIAEGCSNNCTYCAIPAIRGPYRSVPMEDVLEEAHWLAEHHVTELVVIAQDTTRYGCDLYGKSRLPELLRELCHIDGIRWVRVLYCYPERITDELLDVLAEEPHMVPYLDLPIQHCDGEILRRMHRPGNEETLRKTIAHIRERVPDITLRTTLIAGFPGETPAQFEKLCAFVRQQNFARLGCFAYSEEEGTKAAQMMQMPLAVREQRAEAVMRIQTDHMAARQAALVGTQAQVLCDGWDEENGLWLCRTRADAPDIDAVVCVDGNAALTPGEFYTVRIIDSDVYDLYATLAE